VAENFECVKISGGTEVPMSKEVAVMQREVPTWLAVVIILVVLVVVVGAYIYLTKPRSSPAPERPPMHGPGGQGVPGATPQKPAQPPQPPKPPAPQGQ